MANIQFDNKVMPDYQQKRQMPSVENNYQDAYQQRMLDNFSIGGKNMVSGATYTGQQQSFQGYNANYNNLVNVQTQHDPVLVSPPIYSQAPVYTTRPEINTNRNQTVAIGSSAREQRFLEEEKQREAAFIKEQERRMEEAHRKFKQEQDSRRKQFNDELSEVENMKYNPEQILGLELGVKHDIADIKKAYRNLALKYHPDKGGSEEIFKILTKAYMYLTKQNERDSYVEKSFFDLKGDYSSGPSEPTVMEDDFDVQHFNKIFDTNKIDDIDRDEGYGDWMSNEEISNSKPKKIFNQKFNLDVFNKVFDELKVDENETVDNSNKQMTIYQEPEVLAMGASLNYSEVDYKKAGDYSRDINIHDNSGGLHFTDYKKAHTNTKLINPNTVKQRQEYASIEDITIAREKQDFTMNDDDKKYIEEKKRLDEEREYQRQLRLRERDEKISEHSAKVNRLMLGTNVPTNPKKIEYRSN
jgi:curved DNA-binding protein CbpA